MEVIKPRRLNVFRDIKIFLTLKKWNFVKIFGFVFLENGRRFISLNVQAFVGVRIVYMAFFQIRVHSPIWAWQKGNFQKFLDRPAHCAP